MFERVVLILMMIMTGGLKMSSAKDDQQNQVTSRIINPIKKMNCNKRVPQIKSRNGLILLGEIMIIISLNG